MNKYLNNRNCNETNVSALLVVTRKIREGLLFRHKMKKIPSDATRWVNPEDMLISEVSQPCESECCMVPLI